MKYLYVFVILLLSYNAQSQNFVSSDEAVNIITAEKVSDLNQLESMDPVTDAYAQIKLQLSAYDLLTRQLDGNDDVADAVRATVLELGAESSSGAYEQDAFDHPEIQNLKNHLIGLLTQ